MANDDRRSEQFVREVDEELRRDQLKALWDRFAPLIIGACVLVVAVTAGYRGLLWWRERQAVEASERFLAAVETIESGDRAKGEEALKAVAQKGGAYAALARLRLAAEQASSGDVAAAISGYDAVAADTSVSEPLRALARIRAAMLALDTGELVGARERAEVLTEPGNPWRHSAREILGAAAYKAGELQQARGYFAEIQQDAETPPDLWIRSGMMMSLIDGQVAAPRDGSVTGAPEEPAEATTEEVEAMQQTGALPPASADPATPAEDAAQSNTQAPIPPQ
jgi:hypothetical protein